MPRTHTRGSERSIRTLRGPCARERVHWACIRIEGEKEVHIAARLGERGGEQERNERRREARVASRGWVSHSLSMRVGLRYENTAARQ